MKFKKLTELNNFYKGCLCILCILSVIRYVFPGVMQRSELKSDDDQLTYVVSTPTEIVDDVNNVNIEDEDVADLDDDYLFDDDITVNDSSAELLADEKTIEPNTELKTEHQEIVSNSKILSKSSNDKLLPLAARTKFENDKHRIYSVPGSYIVNFPDVQDVQYPSASRWGITPLADRDEIHRVKDRLVYVGANPYIHLDDNMSRSVPYLVPRASELLEHLGRAFMDSLYAKRIPLHKFVVSSVLRTEADVAKLARNNVNATQRSCHLFGTTFDINYNRYYTVSSPNGPKRREVRNDSLKMVLSEVLRDARLEGRCYVRYEKLQPCFHITVR